MPSHKFYRGAAKPFYISFSVSAYILPDLDMSPFVSDGVKKASNHISTLSAPKQIDVSIYVPIQHSNLFDNTKANAVFCSFKLMTPVFHNREFMKGRVANEIELEEIAADSFIQHPTALHFLIL